MTRDQLINLLQRCPEDTKIYVRQGDNAWPAEARVFEETSETVLYFCANGGGNISANRNFPERYGARELQSKRLK